jgi:hypothetical protein
MVRTAEDIVSFAIQQKVEDMVDFLKKGGCGKEDTGQMGEERRDENDRMLTRVH